MVPLHILTLVFSSLEQPAIHVLEPDEPPAQGMSRIVPVWVGPQEAMQIGIAIEGLKPPRPLTHDLFLNALTNLDARVDHVVIHDVANTTFFAKLVLRSHGRLIELDARPTDALSLAVREGAPYYIERDVLDRASFPFLFKEAKNKELEIKEFHSFVKDLNPEDLL